MLDLALIRRHPDSVRESVERRRIDADAANVDRFLELDTRCRDLQTRRDTLKHEQSEVGGHIRTRRSARPSRRSGT